MNGSGTGSVAALGDRAAATGKLGNIVRTALSKLGLDQGYHKVFAIGFNKTATSSIHGVFVQCGLVAMHKRRWRQTWRPFVHWPYQAFSDGPPTRFWQLDARFPRSRFILNTRDLDEWLDSRIEHNTRDGYRPSLAEVRGWIVQRQRHHERVLTYFAGRPHDLLIINFIRDADAAERIAHFVGHVHTVERPHARPAPQTRTQGVIKNRDLVEAGLTELGIPAHEWKLDLLCPSLGLSAVATRLPSDTDDLQAPWVRPT